jgi:N,N'-diacetyllegionaminate synthase
MYPWQSGLYIVGEIGLNHNGDIDLALQSIDMAKAAGCDAVKFQTFKAEEFCDPSTPYTYQSQGKYVTETMRDMFQRCELPLESWRVCVRHAEEVGIDFMTTPQNVSDLSPFNAAELPAIKVGSDDLTNIRHITEVGNFGRPVILSSGMATLAEVARALNALGWPGRMDVAVLVCTSEYPCPPYKANVQRVTTLRNAFPGLVVGLSDHTTSSTAAIAACALGARIFEKHFTPDRGLPGPDHWFSLDADQLAAWVRAIRECELVLGDGIVMPTQSEVELAMIARRSLVYLRDLSQGHIVTEADVGMRRATGGLQSEDASVIAGAALSCAVSAYEAVQWDHFLNHSSTE